MAKDRYQAWYASPHGGYEPLEAISSTDHEVAELLLGKMVRRRSAELDPDSLVSLTDSAGEDVGTPS
ncbi:MAG TPA: hypothetical protein VGW34_03600 [Allosphingosinicella sp.]|nr:hypothetical protein [Allosphingosinicella sp.]